MTLIVILIACVLVIVYTVAYVRSELNKGHVPSDSDKMEDFVLMRNTNGAILAVHSNGDKLIQLNGNKYLIIFE